MIDKIRHFIDYRPLSVLAISGGIRDILLGVGFLFQWNQITQTLIFQNYDSLIPGWSGYGAGILLILAGVIVTITSLLYKRAWMIGGLKAQALLWLFSTLMYTLNGHFLLACIFGLLMLVPAGYIAYYVKFHPARDEELKMLLNPSNEPVDSEPTG